MGVTELAGQVRALFQESQRLQVSVPSLTLRERAAAFQRLAALATQQQALMEQVREEAQTELAVLYERKAVILRQIESLERLTEIEQLEAEDLGVLGQWSEPDSATVVPAPAQDSPLLPPTGAVEAPLSAGMGSASNGLPTATARTTPAKNVPVSPVAADGHMKQPEQQRTGRQTGKQSDRSARAALPPTTSGIVPLLVQPKLLEVRAPEYDPVIRAIGPQFGYSPVYQDKPRALIPKVAAANSKKEPEKPGFIAAQGQPVDTGLAPATFSASAPSEEERMPALEAAALTTTDKPECAPIPATATRTVSDVLSRSREDRLLSDALSPDAHQSPSEEKYPPVVGKPSTGFIDHENNLATIPEPQINPVRYAEYVAKCRSLMMVGTKPALAKGWVLTKWLEQIPDPFPDSLPRPLEIEVASMSLPRLNLGKHVIPTDILAQNLTSATDSVSDGGYDISPCQAHIRLALGLPLLLFSGLEPAFAWVVAAKDQSDSAALRHLATQALTYWQRTHTTLKDAGVLQEVAVKGRRTLLAQHISEHYNNSVVAPFNYAPAAKVRNKFFPRHGDGGLRWIMQTVNDSDVDRMNTWLMEFDSGMEIDRYTRLVSSFREKVDYTARSKLVELLDTLQGLIRDWCSTFEKKGTSYPGGVSSYAREFRDDWHDRVDEYQTAIAGLPEDQAVAREWFQSTFRFFLHHLGGAPRV